MTTAVDSSVLLDVFSGDSRFGPASREALRAAYDAGPLVACEVVWAEVRAHFADDEAFDRAVELLGVRFDAVNDETAVAAGRLGSEAVAARMGAVRDWWLTSSSVHTRFRGRTRC